MMTMTNFSFFYESKLFLFDFDTSSSQRSPSDKDDTIKTGRIIYVYVCIFSVLSLRLLEIPLPTRRQRGLVAPNAKFYLNLHKWFCIRYMYE